MRYLSLLWNAQVVSILSLFAAIVWMLRNEKDKVRVYLVLALLVNLFFGLLLNVGMSEENSLFPLKYDWILFHLDNALGITATSLARHLQGALTFPLRIVYNLMLPMMIAWIPITGYRTPRGSVVLAYVAELVLGPLSYAVVPACGPLYAFGKLWLQPPTPRVSVMHLAGLPNAFPSLHVASAIVLVLFARGGVWRAIALLFLTGTAMTTMGLGEHYLIDLFPGIVFGCFAAAVGQLRLRRALVFLGFVLFWLVAARFGYNILIAHAAIVQALAAVSVMAALAMVIEAWRSPERGDRREVSAALIAAD